MMSTSATSKVNLFFNPFQFVAGMPSLLLGIAGLLAAAALAYLTGTHHYGLLNINFAKDTVFTNFLFEHVIYWAASSILLFGGGFFLSHSSIRLIDVAGTLAISRMPLIFLSLVRFVPSFESFPAYSVNMYFLFVLHVCLAAWSIAWMFNAYKTTCNVKGPKAVASFFGCLVCTEIITQLIIRLSL